MLFFWAELYDVSFSLFWICAGSVLAVEILPPAPNDYDHRGFFWRLQHGIRTANGNGFIVPFLTSIHLLLFGYIMPTASSESQSFLLTGLFLSVLVSVVIITKELSFQNSLPQIDR